MSNLYKTKQTIIFILILGIVGAIVFNIIYNKQKSITPANKAVSTEEQSSIDQKSLNEKLFVENYIKDNISTIATDKAVLGGSWYVTSVNVVPSTGTGEVTYEDGHIQSKASFTYTYDPVLRTVTFPVFELK